jgi:hypothetical protein
LRAFGFFCWMNETACSKIWDIFVIALVPKQNQEPKQPAKVIDQYVSFQLLQISISKRIVIVVKTIKH